MDSISPSATMENELCEECLAQGSEELAADYFGIDSTPLCNMHLVLAEAFYESWEINEND